MKGTAEVLRDEIVRLVEQAEEEALRCVYILLINSNETDSAWVIKRCEERGIKTELIKKNKGKTAEEVFSDCKF